MWAILFHPAHAESFVAHGEAYGPMRQLVMFLAKRPYADALFPYKSLATIVVTFAARYGEDEGRDAVPIQFDPKTGLFSVSYHEWVSSTRNPPHQVATSRSCSQADVLAIVDLYVLRLEMTNRLSTKGG